MKVYELMKALADMPAGAEVVFKRLCELKEIPVYDGNLRIAEFVIRYVDSCGDENKVLLDGWPE